MSASRTASRFGLSALTPAVVVIFLAVCPPATACEPMEGEDFEARIFDIVAEQREARDTRPEQLQARLAALGSEAAPQLFACLARGSLTVREDEGGERVVSLTGLEREALLGALGDLPPVAVRSCLRAVESTSESEVERWMAVRVLGEMGDDEDLPLLVDLSSPLSSERIPVERRQTFRATLDLILVRADRLSVEFAEAYQGLPDELIAPMVQSIGALDSHEGLELLANLLGRVPEADSLLLNELARLGDVLVHPLDEAALTHTRRYLGTNEIELLLLAMDAARRLEDVESIPTLIALLDHPVRAVGNTAVTGLEEMSGKRLGRDPERWSKWYAGASTWWRDKAPALMMRVRSGAVDAASHALLELSLWRIHRHDLTDAVSRGLERGEPEVVIVTCSVLGHLGSWSAVEPLASQLTHPEQSVRAAAARALQRITGQSLSDEQAWLELAARR